MLESSSRVVEAEPIRTGWVRGEKAVLTKGALEMSELEKRLDAAREVLAVHNKAVDAKYAVDCKSFTHNILALGGTSKEGLSALSYEEILQAFSLPKNLLQPIALARVLAKIWRDKSDGAERCMGKHTVEAMSDEALLSEFDLLSPETAVGDQLKKRSRGKRFILLDEEDNLDVPGSSDLLLQLQSGVDEEAEIDGRVVYSVGQRPAQWVDENPLFPGVALRVGRRCGYLHRSWSGIPMEIKQFASIVVFEGLLNPKKQPNAAHLLLDMAGAADAMSRLTARYGKAAAVFNARKKANTLPILKISVEVASTSASGATSYGYAFSTTGARVDYSQ